MAEERKDDNILERTTEIKDGHAGVGKFNIAVEIILAVVCIVYLILHFKP